MDKEIKLVRVLVLCILAMFAIVGCKGKEKNDGDADSDIKGGRYMQISMDEAVDMMETMENYIVLDVRTMEEYREGHIPGAICIPNETISGEMPEELPDKEQLILVYCRSGNRSKKASEKLVALGYTKVYEFGGIIDWKGEIVTE